MRKCFEKPKSNEANFQYWGNIELVFVVACIKARSFQFFDIHSKTARFAHKIDFKKLKLSSTPMQQHAMPKLIYKNEIDELNHIS